MKWKDDWDEGDGKKEREAKHENSIKLVEIKCHMSKSLKSQSLCLNTKQVY